MHDYILVVGCISEEEAKKKIYNVSCERYFGFGCEIDEETSNKLEGIFEIASIYLFDSFSFVLFLIFCFLQMY